MTSGEDGKPRTQFDYLLNAADLVAERISNPPEMRPLRGEYRAKRLALFAYVRELERKVATPSSIHPQEP